MAFSDKITTSLFGRRLGLQNMSTVQTGGSYGAQDYLVGPADFRVGVTTAETTSANLKSHGNSALIASSVGSSQVYTLDPPVPGVSKTIYNSTNATAYVKTKNSEVILSTVGSTQTVIALPAAGVMITLTGLTTALWATNITTASGINLTNST